MIENLELGGEICVDGRRWREQDETYEREMGFVWEDFTLAGHRPAPHKFKLSKAWCSRISAVVAEKSATFVVP